MDNNELLSELTESYLKCLISGISDSLTEQFESSASFGELGIDSFYVLKIIKKLEEDFGLLPKTLLFENFNINDLANYFLAKYREVLLVKFGNELQGKNASELNTEKGHHSDEPRQKYSHEVEKQPDRSAHNPIIVSRKEIGLHPGLCDLIDDIFSRYKNESSVSRGTQNIAPNLFIGSEKKGYFNYSVSLNVLMVYSYTGPDDYFETIAKEILQYSIRNNLEFYMLSDVQIESIGSEAFSATPFGVIQRILNLQEFTLKGQKIRRLRYQISKFKKSGECKTVEYFCGTDDKVDQDIVHTIDRWCETKTMVNPLVRIVRQEIIDKVFSSEHRVFLTCVDNLLQNVIIISPLSAGRKGYLMDLEFYPKDMPLGGLEFAIVEIIDVIAREGCTMLSLGATLGPKLAPSYNADPEVDRELGELREQGIFNDEGNLQFKNKFRTENNTIYLCRPESIKGSRNVTNIIMMIADPERMQQSNQKIGQYTDKSGEEFWGNDSSVSKDKPRPNLNRISSVESTEYRYLDENSVCDRSQILVDKSYNPTSIASNEVEWDLKTDSWAQLSLPSIAKRKAYLQTQLQKCVDVNKSLKNVFPFSNFVLTTSGRSAESCFFKAFENKGVVAQNILFPTTIYHQIDKGFSPAELPDSSIFNIDSKEIYKGNIDLSALEKTIKQDSVSLIYVEMSDNAAGGCPVSIANIRRTRELATEYSIPLAIDGTRIIENALSVIANEKEHAAMDVWQMVRELCSQADVLIASLAKDFCVDAGGLIATNDSELYSRIQKVMDEEGGALHPINRKMVALSFRGCDQIQVLVSRRVENVKAIWDILDKHGVPVVRPVGGHCVLIDTAKIPVLTTFEYPVESFIVWLFLNTGIRVAAHNIGMQRGTALNGLVRLAVPVGLQKAQIEEIGAVIVRLFEEKKNIPELVPEDSDSTDEVADPLNPRFKLVKYHNASAALTSSSELRNKTKNVSQGVSLPEQHDSMSESLPGGEAVRKNNGPTIEKSRHTGTGSEEIQRGKIAIVGMAGRYPHARNITELWDNLAQGRDCIEELPDHRLEMLMQDRSTTKYRGGFIDDIDKFDSLFFNISPREAQLLDPQERLFLETAWEAIEDAGYYPETLAGKDGARNVGVFVGAVWAMYQMIGVEERLSRTGNATPNSFFWSIANRVSYWMNFCGPSLTLDTACSSSLTAIYLACEAIYKKECSAAIVGGTNLDIHQSKLSINRSGGALSEDGVCRSFGHNANGYVAGEGVGAILLKPLKDAIEDRDNIYGVIKSVVVNHGGRTSGYSVPSPKAQGSLISSALTRANIDARTIGYIEAHGTGTELGDPIEIVGLTNAFQGYNTGKQDCAIGSIKSNIGHTEATAGVAGVCKVLLQMKHNQIAPSLHSTELNEHIDFSNSPFYVQQELKEWRKKEIDGIRYPLRAGVSSFGAGGSNAHIILEKYEGGRGERNDTAHPIDHIVPLSARNEQQLKDSAIRLKDYLDRDFLKTDPDLQLDINDIAYTLQVGRKSFEYRLAIVAKTKEEVADALTRFIQGKQDENVCFGRSNNADSITKLLNQKEKEELVSLLSRGRESKKIARLWIDGLLDDWEGVKDLSDGVRTSLPTYPFADKRHWARDEPNSTGLKLVTESAVHPLIDSNMSTFERQLFKKTFTENEFFIYDHLVSDIPTLPGVAYLELARKAGELAAGRKVCKINNIVWVSPLTVKDSMPTEAWIDLKPKGSTVNFEVYSNDDDGAKRLYSQGRLSYEQGELESEFVDLESLKKRCSKAIDGEQAYPLFKSLGLNLGPSFQVLQEVYKSDNEVLGVLKIPQVRENDFHNFVLHPSLVDGSFQAGMAAALGDKSAEMFVPYSIGEVEVFHPLTPVCYSYVTEGKADQKGSTKLAKSNVLILDEEGRILVRIKDSIGVPLTDVHEKPDERSGMKGFSKLYYSHIWESAPLNPELPGPESADILLFAQDDSLWEEYRKLSKPESGHSARIILVKPADSFKILGGDAYQVNPGSRQDYDQLLHSLSGKGYTPSRICFAWAVGQAGQSVAMYEAGAVNELIEKSVYSLLYLCQSLINQDAKEQIRIQYVYTTEVGGVQPHNEAISGFLNTLQLEYARRFSCKTLEIQQKIDNVPAVAKTISKEFHPASWGSRFVRYKETERLERKLQSFDLESTLSDESDAEDPVSVPLKEKGVYLITGGAGGLGLIFARFLAEKYKARLVLTGRSELDNNRQSDLKALRDLGSEVVYVSADVSLDEDVERVINRAKSEFGEINGIVHSAGVIRDSYVTNKTSEEFSDVIAPKVFGTLNLDKLTKDENLDWFVLFSSVAAIAGNLGQCDYAFANNFMDSFAFQREMARSQGKRAGRTLSLNWSVWADGGMQLDEQTELFFKKNLGVNPLSVETGIEAFSKGLSSGLCQFAVVEAVQEKIEQAWGLRKPEQEIENSASSAGAINEIAEPENNSDNSTAAPDDELAAEVQATLSGIVMELLQVEAEDISLDKMLLDLGFDSIGLATYANSLNEKYELDITPVLFFEYPSIKEITDFLCTEHKDEVLKVHSVLESRSGPGSITSLPATGRVIEEAARQEETIGLSINKGWSPAVQGEESSVPTSDDAISPSRRFIDRPIAIVGISGVMPQSEDVEEFWDNLKNARDLVTVIPEDRWDWKEYDGDPLKEQNKTNSKWGGFMKEVDKFDPLFFGISPKESELMDPQQRIFLETVWKAIEDSGHKVSELAGTKTGLFVGVATTDYKDMISYNQVPIHAYTSTGNSHSVLANRVSFLLDLHGPSAPLDTACSSSLVATHRAVESIHTGSCDMAIVGGVQVMTSPAGYVAFGQAGMLASDGKCKTFDKNANGYVRGEGAGAIFLKTLSKAEADGDHIYALIKSTAENHGGTGAALTAPNPNAQADLLIDAYEKAQIDPASVGYIECHGTGTSLGDPIEIQALKKAFSVLHKKYNGESPKTAHCGLSSVKTNIGHLETAAGIAGILKVLLSIKHKKIPPLVHFEELNPYINLAGSPFYIVDKTMDWNAATDSSGSDLPRRAGVSSFGFGGANAHVVLEEYPVKDVRDSATEHEPQLIILSAKRTDRLEAYAHSLIKHLDKYDVSLPDVAYTLQVGRDEMPERLAVIADSNADLREKLTDYLEGGANGRTILSGSLKKNQKSSTSKHMHVESLNQASMQDFAEENNLARIAEAWISGVTVDFSALHNSASRKRVSLPCYPFARESYWATAPIEDSESRVGRNVGLAKEAILHAMVHRNSSTFKEQKFTSRFAGSEFYLADHVVETQKILPGVAYMEIARAAGELSAEAPVHAIKDLVWMRPLIISDEPKDIEISLIPEAQNVRFTIRTLSSEQSITNCIGTLSYSSNVLDVERLDLEGIKERCWEEVLKGEELYAHLHGLGLNLGKSFQIVERIYATESESLSRLIVPDRLKKDANQYWLHPALMDGSLHTAVGLMKKSSMDVPSSLPYKVEEVQILRPLDDLYYGYATWGANDAEDHDLQKVDIQLLDRYGNILVKIKGFSSRPLNARGMVNIPSDTKKTGTIGSAKSIGYYRNVWKKTPLADSGENKSAGNILIFDSAETIRNALKERLSKLCSEDQQVILVKPGSHYLEQGNDIYQINPDNKEDYKQLFETLDVYNWVPDNILYIAGESVTSACILYEKESVHADVFSVFYISQELTEIIRRGKRNGGTANATEGDRVDKNLIYVYENTTGYTGPHQSAICGLGKCVSAESGKISYRVVEFASGDRPSQAHPSRILDGLVEELLDPQRHNLQVRYDENHRWSKSIEELELSPVSKSGLKEKGVYLITGGMGGLGLIFSEYLADKIKARLVLTGRSTLTTERKKLIENLMSKGAEVEYYQTDVSKIDEVHQLVDKIKSRFGEINGIIHAAGVTHDALIANKTVEEIEKVCAAKVAGTLNLDEVTKNDTLDFFALFSSITATTGNIGQCDYAYANSFLDNFSERRNTLENNKQRSGTTISYSWPLWKSGGIQIDAQTQEYVTKTTGMAPLEAAIGLETFDRGLGIGAPHILVVEGDQSKIRTTLGLVSSHSRQNNAGREQQAVVEAKAESQSPSKIANHNAPLESGGTASKLLGALKDDLFQLVVQTLGIRKEIFSYDVDMIEYGLDSISLSKFFSDINGRYDVDLTPAVFFEYPTFNSLSQFLIEEYHGQIKAYFGVDIVQSMQEVPLPAASDKADNIDRQPVTVVNNRLQSPSAPLFTDIVLGDSRHSTENQPIAVVGMAGVMPGSKDLNEFWDNLIAGRNLVSEIPSDRWDWRAFQGDPVKGKNKTNSKWGGFMGDVDKFDPSFFGVSPLEAEFMDPQQRIFLQTVWKTIEDAGHRASELSRTKTGVFVGVGGHDYLDVMRDNQVDVVAYASTGNTHSVLANRISYILDLRGDSEPVDTACSSSLVAVHRAVEAIQSGSCDMAIAGGVNVLLSPILYLSFGNAGMLASDGKCKSFDGRADGYVRGEGVGAVFLKKLPNAVADRNHIYGIIRGTGVNHGGNATALTAPNPNAQADLIADVYRRAEVDPSTIGYIEAHGTGTSLGDPVEINGLLKAFKILRNEKRPGIEQSEQEQEYCAVGSVKTNIGHLETAAGIAGVLKVLMSIKHKKIPANIHFKEINPHIRISGTPFYIADAATDWKALRNSDGRTLPRRAGVSSFGFGGANSHILLEEYIPDTERAEPAWMGEEYIIPLSAKTEDGLRQRVTDLLDFIERTATAYPIDLESMAYTLQVGREVMNERLVIKAASLEDISRKLRLYLDGNEEAAEIYTGRVKRDSDVLSLISGDHDVADAVLDKLISSGKIAELMHLWSKGLNFDWERLYREGTPIRMSLPTYPFAKERYWVDMSNAKKIDAQAPVSSQLHPMLHENTSNLDELSFTSLFNGDEYFLEKISNSADENSRARRLSIGGYLEMANAAVDFALPDSESTETIELQNIIWAEPFSVNNSDGITVALLDDDDEHQEFAIIGFEFYSASGDDEVTHCSGQAILTDGQYVESVDIEEMKARLQVESRDLDNNGLIKPEHIDCSEMGCDYEIIQAGQVELLVRLTLGPEARDDLNKYHICPVIADSAIQVCASLLRGFGVSPNLSAGVVALNRLIVVQPCTEDVIVWGRKSTKTNTDESIVSIDIDIYDPKGRPCILLKELSFKTVELKTEESLSRSPIECLDKGCEIALMAPRWDVVPALEQQKLPRQQGSKILVIGTDTDSAALITEALDGTYIEFLDISSSELQDTLVEKLDKFIFDRILWLTPRDHVTNLTDNAIIERQQLGVLAILKFVKSLNHLGYNGKELHWDIVTFNTQRVCRTDSIDPTHSTLQGYSGSMAKEFPSWYVRIIDLQDLSALVIRNLDRLPSSSEGVSYAYRNNQWFKQKSIPVRTLPLSSTQYRREGVYVVIGGSGGLGEIWSRYVIETYSAQVVWIGRREFDDEIKDKIVRLGKSGRPPEYIQADATNLEELNGAYGKIKSKHPQIHGVVHAAVGRFDESIFQVDEDNFKEILSVKVDVSVRLAQVFEKERLDIVLFFSSGASFARSPGMSGYSAGCTFKDTFALALSKSWQCNVKVVNWGYWNVGTGNAISDSMKALVYSSGQRPIKPEEGMRALEMILSGKSDQLGVFKILSESRHALIDENESLSFYSDRDSSSRFGNVTTSMLLEDQKLPSVFKTADERDGDDMESLVCQILYRILESRKKIDDSYTRWCKASEEILRDKGYVTNGKPFISSGKAGDLVSLWRTWDQSKTAWLQDPNKRPVCILVEECLRALPDILAGARKATDVMFPNSSLELVEGFYTSPISLAYNEILANTLVEAIESRLKLNPSASLKILEIGAGTGATTDGVIKVLKPYQKNIEEYCYTDLSRAFLLHAQSAYSRKAPYLRTRIFDVEMPISGQGIDAGGYDFAIAANVLHATRNIRNTLRNVKAALRNGGALLLNEISVNSIYPHVTFGLLEGWWMNEDEEIRIPGTPALSPIAWEQVLQDEGFDPVVFPREDVHKFGQQIVFAVSDGEARQKSMAPDHSLTRPATENNNENSQSTELELGV